MKTLIDIDRIVWAKLKEYATLRDLSLSRCVEILLLMALQLPESAAWGRKEITN